MNSASKILRLAFGVGILVTAAGSAVAADTHDYSTYVRLKKSVSFDTKASTNPPPASAWNPEGEMDDDHAYLIPAGMTLTSKTSSSYLPATWPGIELAIEGVLSISATGSRSGTAVTPRVALLPGGKISMTSAYSTVDGDTLDVRGTAANPAVFSCTYRNADGEKATYYPLIKSAVTGEADAVVRFERKVVSDGYDLARAFRLTRGFAGFYGTVIVTGPVAWLRDSSASSFDLGGAMRLEDGAGLYLGKLSPTFGGLSISNAVLQLAGGKTLTVDGRVTLTNGAKIVVDKISTTAFVYSTSSKGPPTVPFLSVCGADNAAAVDRSALHEAVIAGGLNFSGTLDGGVPQLCIVESVRTDGGVDFAVSHHPVVNQITKCGSHMTPYGGGEAYYSYLSDGKPVSQDNDYVSSMAIYFDGDMPYRFPGHSWTVSDRMGFYGGHSIVVDDLRFVTGAYLRTMSTGSTQLGGAACLYGRLTAMHMGNSVATLAANLSGVGDLYLSVDITKAIEKNTMQKATYVLSGTNTAYAGRILVGATNYVSGINLATTNVTLRVAESVNLGGALGEPTFDAVRVSELCMLEVTDSATFSAENRGWCLADGSTVNVAADKVVRIDETVTFGAAVTKKGAGCLVLGGAARFHDAENDVSVETPNGATLTVAAGTLGFASTSALAGVTVGFGAGTSLVVDFAATGDVKAKGLVNPTFADNSVPLSFTAPAEMPNTVTVAICTVPVALKDTLKFDAPGRFARRRITVGSVDNGDGTVTITATAEKTGVLLIVR